MAPKKKGEKMALGDFLGNQSLGSWADEMDSVPVPSAPSGYGARDRRDDGPSERRAFNQPDWGSARADARGPPSGMGGGMGDRGASYDRPRYDREAVPFPTKPPYTAHLGNLDYNVTSVDIEGFLEGCSVTTVRIMEDKIDRKPKGFGYVEFASPEGLTKALDKSESSFMGRNIKISVADPPKNDRAESTRDFSDWSRRGPLPDLPSQGRQPSNRGFNRGGAFDDARSDAGSERAGSGRRPGFFEDDGKVRDLGNWERKGPLSPVPGQPGGRDGGRLREAGPPGDRRPSAAWGEGRSDAGSRPPRREFEPRPERAPTAAEQDNQWRTKMKPDASPAPTPDVSSPTSPAQETPKERPRLNLTKRTVSTAEPSSATTPSADAKASPFGAARPIDTATREREVEEKRQIVIREKEESDKKAAEEKKEKDAAAHAARAERADRGQAEGEKVTSPTGERPPRNDRRPSRQQQQNGGGAWRKEPAKENGEGPPQPKASFNVLQTDGADEAGGLDTPDADAKGTIIGDKETKPQEPVVAANGDAKDTAEALEDDGWSTVPAKTKNNRRAGGRAMAS
ncbi:putative eukaryotic translation initiation factor 4H [Fulvia fulva]|uniref:Eukaryotic translation initiation factor 4H n=1 Tax=Passalora fulva TaxID=5499 RepID=A0A9Q8L9U4_PASFU|nr:putative eukaryotic translation initiation factor 4H [Fulvia fulva]KAK4631514.1 putative eukaryotic translation initiation factor 4H [Fulvia fulva]KAK4632778.1 putative eukaryotic translation initiation factor 4H [Fulvia fulva]UJO13359.1 putative eukaryotic translation initiation factor 4H [Fulvia fulva]WPV10979.1 putative eukaryotic translation initiation factor 4H [Fulvia fulva]WPV26826.1 putative eukaryotic translation initiation factor 4H [Fulvia fulva]